MFKLKYHQDFPREGTQKNAYSSYLFYIDASLFQLRQNLWEQNKEESRLHLEVTLSGER